MRKNWTPDEKYLLLCCWNEKRLTAKEIARLPEFAGRSPASIWDQIRYQRITKNTTFDARRTGGAEHSLWTAERVHALYHYWNTEAVSAGALERQPEFAGLTRAAIVGMVFRLRLSGVTMRASAPIARKPWGGGGARWSSSHQPPRGRRRADDVAPPAPCFLGVTLLELEAGQCRFADGEPTRYCGAPAELEASGRCYCAFHQFAMRAGPAGPRRRSLLRCQL